jgi:hypothetical protein
MSYGMKNMEEEKKELSRAVTQITLCQNWMFSFRFVSTGKTFCSTDAMPPLHKKQDKQNDHKQLVARWLISVMHSNNPLSDNLYEFLSETKWGKQLIIRIKLKINKRMYARKDGRNK